MRPPAVKFFNVGDAQGIHSASPDTILVYRKWCPDQGQFLNEVAPGQWALDVDGYVEWLRPELEEIAAAVGTDTLKVVESINEEVPTHNPAKLAAIVEFDRQFCYKVAGLNLGFVAGILTAGVGNPDHGAEVRALIPAVRAACETGAFLMPHAYGPACPSEDWFLNQHWDLRPFLSWDPEFVAEGLYPRYIIGEMGPIQANDCNPAVLNAGGGWRAPGCLNGDWNRCIDYLLALNAWVRRWNAEHGNRCLGLCLFTSGIGTGWEHFQYGEAEFNDIAAALGR